MKMIAGRALRALRNSRRMRAAPRPTNISTNDAADWAKNLAFASVGGGLGEQRLAGAGRAVQQDALRHRRAELAEALGVAQEVDDLAQLLLGLVGAGDVVPADRGLRVGLDLLRLGARHEPQHPEQDDRDQAHEDQGQPREHPLLDAVPRQSDDVVTGSIVGTAAEKRYEQTSRRAKMGSRPYAASVSRRRISARAACPTSIWSSRRLPRPHQPLDLVAGAPQRLRERRIRVALGPAEHLDGDRQAAQRDRPVGGRARSGRPCGPRRCPRRSPPASARPGWSRSGRAPSRRRRSRRPARRRRSPCARRRATRPGRPAAARGAPAPG